jgi:alpha-glucosidase
MPSTKTLIQIGITLLASLCLSSAAFAQSNFTLRSPDGRIEVTVSTRDHIRFSLSHDGKPLMQDSTLAVNIDGHTLGDNPKVLNARQQSVNRELQPVVRQKSATIRENYNELRIEFQGNYSVVFRAYNEGAAYRFETALPEPRIRVNSETVNLNFAGDYNVYYPKEDSFFSHNEREFVYLPLKEISSTTIASVPAVIDVKNGPKIAIADADVVDYPGMWFRGNGGNGLSGIFPPYPLKEELTGDRDFKVTQAAGYIAETAGRRTYPWRVFGVAPKDGDLLTNQLVYMLARPSEIKDTTWIKPGKVAWDWYNANNLYGVDFKAGINTQTYKYYIDFASKYGLDYIILDEGWYKLGNLLEVVPDMDVAELTAYGRKKNVGVILWTVWKTLDDQFAPAFDQFGKWGVKGIKVDFMQRDDQVVINFYEKVSREAAKRKMLVDFHGAIRPATMTRTWPNLITAEGVRGLEQNKWGTFSNPEHNLTIPFTRMFLGPMDYTPGAMVNGGKKSFAPIFERPMSQGTRCHQLAMYVVYESPLQMLADSPSHYLREPEVMEFLGPVPTTWDETRVLDAKIGDYIVIARRKGREWYVGAMTDWSPRKFQVDLSFLPAGNFQMQSFQDGPNASRYGNDFRKTSSRVNKTARFEIDLAEGGGWASRISPLRSLTSGKTPKT